MDNLIPEDLVPGVNAPPAHNPTDLRRELAQADQRRAAILDAARSRRQDLMQELDDLNAILGDAPEERGAKRGKKGSPANPRGAVLEAVKSFFTANAEGGYKAEAVAKATGYALESVRSSIRTAIKSGHIIPVERGRFTLRTHGNA